MKSWGIELEWRQKIQARGVSYRILEKLGAGGNSDVYLVEAMGGDNHGLLFALKVFTRVSDKTRLGRFHREVEFLTRTNHPSLMHVFDGGEIPIVTENGMLIFPFVVAEYLPKTLWDALRGGISMVEKLSYALQLLSALAYLSKHEPQVVHRDIKPQNIFVRGNACVLGDFGLMKVLVPDSEKDEDFLIESTGPRLPRFYRTPDLVDYCRGQSELSVKSDVFQLGLVLAEMFSGRNPLRPVKNILDPVELDPLEINLGSQAAAIKGLIENMLQSNPIHRPHAADMMDSWEGVFLEVVNTARSLEGRVFAASPWGQL